MDYEKKYKEALEWIRKKIQGKVGIVIDEKLDERFPELAEPEYERTRKEILEMLYNHQRFLLTKNSKKRLLGLKNKESKRKIKK